MLCFAVFRFSWRTLYSSKYGEGTCLRSNDLPHIIGRIVSSRRCNATQTHHGWIKQSQEKSAPTLDPWTTVTWSTRDRGSFSDDDQEMYCKCCCSEFASWFWRCELVRSRMDGSLTAWTFHRGYICTKKWFMTDSQSWKCWPNENDDDSRGFSTKIIEVRVYILLINGIAYEYWQILVDIPGRTAGSQRVGTRIRLGNIVIHSWLRFSRGSILPSLTVYSVVNGLLLWRQIYFSRRVRIA